MRAHSTYAVFTARPDEPPRDLLAKAGVPALDPAFWQLEQRELGEDDQLREVLRTLAFERQPPISRRDYPRAHAFTTALLLQLARDDSLYPDGIAFAVAAVEALAQWARGPVVDLTAEKVWTRREWHRQVAGSPFDPRQHVAVHADWGTDGRSASLHTHGMAKFAHPEFAALDVPDEGTRAVGQLMTHLAGVRATTLEPLEPGHAFDPGFGQPMVGFVELDRVAAGHGVAGHLGASPSVVVDFDVDANEAVEGLYGLLAAVHALDRPVPAERRRWALSP